jgi:dehydrogenase/reductase SDR family member 1
LPLPCRRLGTDNLQSCYPLPTLAWRDALRENGGALDGVRALPAQTNSCDPRLAQAARDGISCQRRGVDGEGNLTGLTALVTGASRGVGRGIALALGAQGATVWVTGRSSRDKATSPLGGSPEKTAEDVTARGGRGVPVVADARDEEAMREVVARVDAEHGALDVLVCNAWGGYSLFHRDEPEAWQRPYWEQPRTLWDETVGSVRGTWVTLSLATPLLLRSRRGLVVATSFLASWRFEGNLPYGVSKTATDRLIADAATQLLPRGVCAVALHPGLVRTELIERDARWFDLSNSESPELSGRVVAALAADPHRLDFTGRALLVAELAAHYGVRDVDGRRPESLRADFGGGPSWQRADPP